jgi:hypothetical protein
MKHQGRLAVNGSPFSDPRQPFPVRQRARWRHLRARRGRARACAEGGRRGEAALALGRRPAVHGGARPAPASPPEHPSPVLQDRNDVARIRRHPRSRQCLSRAAETLVACVRSDGSPRPGSSGRTLVTDRSRRRASVGPRQSVLRLAREIASRREKRVRRCGRCGSSTCARGANRGSAGALRRWQLPNHNDRSPRRASAPSARAV